MDQGIIIRQGTESVFNLSGVVVARQPSCRSIPISNRRRNNACDSNSEKEKTIGIGFDPATGNLSKYGLKKESQLSENTEAINNAIGSLTTELTSLRTALDAKKEKEEEEKKKD